MSKEIHSNGSDFHILYKTNSLSITYFFNFLPDQNSNMKQGVEAVPKTFVANEQVDGRTVTLCFSLQLLFH